MFAHSPEVARKWVHEYGHAKGYHEYLKKKKRKKRSHAEIAAELERTAETLEGFGLTATAQKLRSGLGRMARTAQAQPPANVTQPQRYDMSKIRLDDPSTWQGPPADQLYPTPDQMKDRRQQMMEQQQAQQPRTWWDNVWDYLMQQGPYAQHIPSVTLGVRG